MDQQVEKDLTERVLRPGSGGGGGGNNTLNIVHTKILHNHWKVYYVYFITWNGLKAQLNLLLAMGEKKVTGLKFYHLQSSERWTKLTIPPPYNVIMMSLAKH